MKRVLCLLFHVAPSLRELFEGSVRAAGGVRGGEVSLVLVARSGLSSAYDQLIRECGGALGVLDRFAPDWRAYDRLVLGSYSAGYAAVRALLEVPEVAARCSGLVSIDSWHAGRVRGVVDRSRLGGAVGVIRRALDGEAAARWVATDVETGPSVAPTSAVLRELGALTGAPVPGAAGGWSCELVNEFRSPLDEHRHVLRSRGPAVVGAVVGDVLDQGRVAPAAVEAPGAGSVRLALGEVASESVRLALAELRASPPIHEIHGSRHHPRIVEYLAGCVRGGRRLGLSADEIPWCAAAQGWIMDRAWARCGRSGRPPHRWRASVAEYWADGLADGLARTAEDVRSGAYVIQPGDLWIEVRGAERAGPAAAPFPGGQGHTGRVVELAPDWLGVGRSVAVCEANVDDGWALVQESIDAPSFVGVIACGGSPPAAPTHEALEVAARLWRIEAAATGRPV